MINSIPSIPHLNLLSSRALQQVVSPARSGASADIEGTWERARKQKHLISNATKRGLKLDFQLPKAQNLIRR